ncbi:MAG: cytochrome b5 domain-containing protein [Candidatus Methanofastidiosia archaeon]
MRKFSKEELAQYDGKNKTPVYVAYKGKVYDVSNSFLWKNGNHQVFHKAGQDLTTSLEHAPHDADLLEKFPVVGIIHENCETIDESSKESLQE